jgi:hypothetical protein
MENETRRIIHDEIYGDCMGKTYRLTEGTTFYLIKYDTDARSLSLVMTAISDWIYDATHEELCEIKK